MTDNTSLINIGELSKPATVLIEKVSNAIGGIFKPWQIRRVAQAEAEAEKIKATSQIEIKELQMRAFQRFMAEEAKKQTNIEEITAKALPQINETAQPENMEDDWITNFFDKCRLISDEEMQILWSKVLAGEANSPGTYSKRTVNFLDSLDKTDASLFQSLCGFGWLIGNVVPVIYEESAEIYAKNGVNFGTLKHLDEIGLLSFDNLGGYKRIHLPKKISVTYYGRPINIEFEKESENELDMGYIMLSKVGQELAPICGSQPVPGFFDFIVEEWKIKRGMNISIPIHFAPESNLT